MMRLSMIFLVLILIGAAAGRYRAEVEMRHMRGEIRKLENARQEAASDIVVLRAEIAYLESPARLARIAGLVTSLQPLNSKQMMRRDEFLTWVGGAPEGSGGAPEGFGQDGQSAEAEGAGGTGEAGARSNRAPAGTRRETPRVIAGQGRVEIAGVIAEQ